MATVDAIVEAAAQVLRREGLNGTTTARIAERAGVSVGTLYQYFPNKEAIYERLGDDLIAAMVAADTAVLARIPLDGDLATLIPGMVDALLEVHAIDPLLQQQLARFEIMNGLTRIQAYQDREVALVAAALGARPDLVRPLDAQLVAQVLILAFGGIVERWARDDPGKVEDPAVRLELAALVAGYLSPDNPVIQRARALDQAEAEPAPAAPSP